LAHLRHFKELRKLFLGGRGQAVSEAGLANLVGLPHLQELWLYDVATDACVARLAGLKELRSLYLGGTVTDAGLVHLRHLDKLRVLYLMPSRVTPEGRIELLKALPELRIR
jgi:hypothetical protein